MTTQQVTQYTLTLPETQQKETKNGKWTVFTKGDVVFLLIKKNDPIFSYITLKLPEAKGIELQDEYNIVSPATIGMKGWLDVDIDNNFPAQEIESWIKESYDQTSEADMEKYISLNRILGI